MATKFFEALSKWRVPIACSTIMFHQYGILRTASLLYVESIDRYNTDRNQASFPHVLRLTTCYLIAPIAGYLSCRFGLERVILIGCLLSSLAIGSCFFAEDILTVILAWGVFSGIGLGMAVSLLYAAVSSYYTKNLTTANGIVAAGSSVGGFVYSPICKIAIDKFGLSGTFLIICALTLNAIPAAMLLMFSRQHKKKIDRKKDVGGSKTDLDQNSFRIVSGNKYSEENLSEKSSLIIGSGEIAKHSEKYQEQNISQDFMQSKPPIRNPVDMILAENSDKYAEKNSNCINISCINNGASGQANIKNNLQHLECAKENAESKNSEVYLPNQTDVDQKRHSIDQENTVCNYADKEIAITHSENICLSNAIKEIQDQQTQKLSSKFSIFYDPLFLLISFVHSLYLVTLMTHHTILAEYVTDKGFQTTDAAFIIMCGGLTDIAGRLSLGWVTDHGFMSVPNYSAALFVCYGICFAVFALCKEMIGLTLLYAVICFLLGGIMSILPALVSLNFEGNRKTMAFASSFILYVPLSFAISPLIEFFRGNLGSYEEMYYLLTCICVLCTILILLISICKRRKDIKT